MHICCYDFKDKLKLITECKEQKIPFLSISLHDFVNK